MKICGHARDRREKFDHKMIDHKKIVTKHHARDSHVENNNRLLSRICTVQYASNIPNPIDPGCGQNHPVLYQNHYTYPQLRYRILTALYEIFVNYPIFLMLWRQLGIMICIMAHGTRTPPFQCLWVAVVKPHNNLLDAVPLSTTSCDNNNKSHFQLF